MNETQADAVGSRGHENDRVRRSLGWAIANHKEVVVVVHQLVRGGESGAQGPADRSNQPLIRRAEFSDEGGQLLRCADSHYVTVIIGVRELPDAPKTTIFK